MVWRDNLGGFFTPPPDDQLTANLLFPARTTPHDAIENVNVLETVMTMVSGFTPSEIGQHGIIIVDGIPNFGETSNAYPSFTFMPIQAYEDGTAQAGIIIVGGKFSNDVGSQLIIIVGGMTNENFEPQTAIILTPILDTEGGIEDVIIQFLGNPDLPHTFEEGSTNILISFASDVLTEKLVIIAQSPFATQIHSGYEGIGPNTAGVFVNW
jgi:hypothetical protein